MSQQTIPYWGEPSDQSTFPSLDSTLKFDIVVIGGGFTGLSTAMHLKLAGKTVAVVEQNSIGSGESGRTTAHITEILDARYTKLRAEFGKKNLLRVAKACRAANSQIAQWIEKWQIECGYEEVPGFLYATTKADEEELRKELKRLEEVDFQATWISEIPLPFATYGGIRIEKQAQFHPNKYLRALASRFHGDGCQIFENSRVLKVDEGRPCRVFTQRGELISREIVMATHSPNFNRVLVITKIPAYRTYAIAAKLSRPPLVRGLYWELQDPYHYIREHDSNWIIGGEDHKTGMSVNPSEKFDRLVEYGRRGFGLSSVLNSWSGQILNSIDGLPYIGRNPGSKTSFIATGFSGNGVTFGTLSGMLISDLLLNRENAWEDIFYPDRVKPLSCAVRFVMENKDYPIMLLKDRLAQKAPEDPEQKVESLLPGEGCVVTQDGNTLAVYCDQNSELSCVSAVCPHLGCLVHWNSAERSWDCPCHGSRFNTDGNVLNGPATQALKSIDLPVQMRRKKAA